jgi:GGDEF domain-containing protein
VAEKIRRAVAAEPVATATDTIEMTVSVGVSGLACFRDRGAVTADHLLSRADDCLYSSKNAGRDCITLDTAQAASVP